jgi:hypothetical protein
LQLDPSERNDQITNLVIAIANACIVDHLGEYTAEVLVARGWIVPIGDVWQRITDLEGVVAANHTQVTEQITDVTEQITDLEGVVAANHTQVTEQITDLERVVAANHTQVTEQLAQVLAALGHIQNQNQNA